MRTRTLLFLLLLPMSSSYANEADDHPLMERYPGFELMQKRSEQHASFMFPLSVPAGHETFKQGQKVEGELTQLAYEQTSGASALQVMRNYEEALAKAGAKIEYTCIDTDCLGNEDYHPLHVMGSQNALIVSHESEKFALLTASLSQQGEIYWLAVIAGQFKDYTRYELVILRQAQMQTGLITVDEILQGIQNQGKVALYGIYFDSGKAEIKAESNQTLQAIHQFLQQHPTINLYVVGHTDYTGSLSNNISLSEQRAKAVVRALVERGTDGKRLEAQGVGPLAPVATNAVDSGRQLNRRVELVLSRPQ